MDPRSNPSDLEARQKPLEHFRAKTKRLKIHPLESALVAVVSAQLIFQPWALGGVKPWAQWIGLGLSLLSFGLALLPREYNEEHTGSNRFRLVMWPKLLKFPLFWIGLTLLALVVTQALNPAWEYRSDGKNWWMLKIPHITWLPAGVRGPFAMWNPWRLLITYTSVWLTVCAIWTGCTRRRSVQALFTVVAATGVSVAAFGITEKLLPNGKIFWVLVSPNEFFFSSFIYKNHAGAYLLLTLATTCGLAAWYYLRGLRRLEKSNPSGVLVFLATCIAVSILVSYARGATLIMLVFLSTTVLVFLAHQFRAPAENRKATVTVVLIAIFGFFLKTGLDALHSHEAWSRIKIGLEGQDTSLASRALVTKASGEMLHDYWLRGAGAGSFRFLFPTYQHRYPKLVQDQGEREYWEHAHNDILELPIELGLAGILLVSSAAGYLLLVSIRACFWKNPVSGCIAFGAGLLLVSSWWDFPFHNPAILLSWCVLLVISTMWARFEDLNLSG